MTGEGKLQLVTGVTSPHCVLFHHCDLDERDMDDRDLDDRDLDDRDDWDDRTTEAPPSSNFISPVFFPQH